MPRLRQWLTAACSFYPLFVAAQAVANAVPGLALAALPGFEIHAVRLRPLSVLVRSGPSSGPASDAALLALTLAIVAAAAILLVGVARRAPWLAGLAIGLLGQALLQSPLQVIFFFRRFDSTSIAQLLVGFALLLAGLWAMSQAVPDHVLSRLALLLASFPVPLAALWLTLGSFGGLRGRPGVWMALPSALACMIAGVFPRHRSAITGTLHLRWHVVWIGTTVTVALVLGLPRAGEALSRRLTERRLSEGRTRVATIPLVPADAPFPKQFFQRGVNFTAEFPASYGTKASLEALERLPSYGVNAIALVPYGSSSGQPPRVRLSNSAGSWESDEGIEILARMAHHLGLRVMLKPHLWSRGVPHSRIDLSDPTAREQWFDDYQRFLEHYAQFATRIHADVLCIGVELESVTVYETQWRRLAARVRELYPGPLVYAANFGAEFQTITWWDAVDYIGLDNYYPLPSDFSTAEIERRISAVQASYGRPVLFTEAGFASRRGSNVAPWDDSAGELSTDEQTRGYEALFTAFYSKPWFAGAYWWKVGTNGYGGPKDGSHTPWGKPAMEVVRRWYLSGGR